MNVYCFAFSNAGKDIGGFFEGVFGKRRRKRALLEDGCGIKAVLPNVDINVPGVDLNALKDWAKSKFCALILTELLIICAFRNVS